MVCTIVQVRHVQTTTVQIYAGKVITVTVAVKKKKLIVQPMCNGDGLRTKH